MCQLGDDLESIVVVGGLKNKDSSAILLLLTRTHIGSLFHPG